MLMLIGLHFLILPAIHYFNTSHVNVNRPEATLVFSVSDISIHLMLMLIWFAYYINNKRTKISIHLMLMLITEELQGYNSFSNFNTSHVNVNRKAFHVPPYPTFISIHLMLMLIASNILASVYHNKFQYISC